MSKPIKMYSIPYYPELEGVDLCGGVKAQSSHVLLYGLILALSYMYPEKGCFAKTERLVEIMKISLSRFKHIRAELLSAGWITVKRNRFGEITNIYPNITLITPTGATHNTNITPTGATHDTSECYPGGFASAIHDTCSTEELPLSDNINYRKKDNIDASSPKGSDASPSVDVDMSPSPNGSGSDIKTELSSSFDEEPNGLDPFGGPLNGVASLKSLVDDKQKENRRAGAVATKLRKIAGLSIGSPSGKMVTTVKKFLKDYTAEQLEEFMEWANTHDFWQTIPPESRLTQKALDEWQLTKTGVKRKGNWVDMGGGKYFRIPEM